MNDRLTELRRAQGPSANLGDESAMEMGGKGGAFAQPAFMNEFFTDVEAVKVSEACALCSPNKPVQPLNWKCACPAAGGHQ